MTTNNTNNTDLMNVEQDNKNIALFTKEQIFTKCERITSLIPDQDASIILSANKSNYAFTYIVEGSIVDTLTLAVSVTEYTKTKETNLGNLIKVTLTDRVVSIEPNLKLGTRLSTLNLSMSTTNKELTFDSSSVNALFLQLNCVLAEQILNGRLRYIDQQGLIIIDLLSTLADHKQFDSTDMSINEELYLQTIIDCIDSINNPTSTMLFINELACSKMQEVIDTKIIEKKQQQTVTTE